MASRDTLIDGDWTRPSAVGAKRFYYPFLQNGDRVSAYFEEDNWQTGALFTPATLSIPHEQLRDFYLIVETPPVFGLANLLGFTRTFSRIPSTQVTYGSQAITKPSPSTFGVASSNVFDNTGSFLSLAWLYSGYIFTNNQVYRPTVAVTSVNSGLNTRVTWALHGQTGSLPIIFDSTAEEIFTSGQYTVVDPNTIDLLGVNLGVTVTAARSYLRAYTPGTDRVGVKLSQAFYLPGVTAGITTPADIPIPSPLLNDLELVNSLLVNLTGYQTYDSTTLAQWMGSPIYTQTAIQINMADL